MRPERIESRDAVNAIPYKLGDVLGGTSNGTHGETTDQGGHFDESADSDESVGPENRMLKTANG